jgi:glycosyltransferase involved in cell wall biosynthesis
MKKIFSIIIPTYNVEEKIVKSLESIILQEEDLYECIVIDGNSTDNTIKNVDKYVKQYPNNIRYISEPDKGIYDAMNKGVSIAEGDYLYFLGAGDSLKKSVLDKVSYNLNFKLELVYGDVFWEESGYRIGGEFSKKRICFDNLCHQSIFYKKEIFDIVGKYNLDYPVYADAELNLKCFGHDKINTKYIDLVIANYEGGGFSTSNQDKLFIANRDRLILEYLGQKYYEIYTNASCKVWLNKDFIDIITKEKINNVVIFGASDFGKNLFNFLGEINNRYNKELNVKYFMDNSPSKWDKKFCNIIIKKPNVKLLEQIDKIIIASMPGKVQIREQLLEMGVSREKIISAV